MPDGGPDKGFAASHGMNVAHEAPSAGGTAAGSAWGVARGYGGIRPRACGSNPVRAEEGRRTTSSIAVANWTLRGA